MSSKPSLRPKLLPGETKMRTQLSVNSDATPLTLPGADAQPGLTSRAIDMRDVGGVNILLHFDLGAAGQNPVISAEQGPAAASGFVAMNLENMYYKVGTGGAALDLATDVWKKVRDEVLDKEIDNRNAVATFDSGAALHGSIDSDVNEFMALLLIDADEMDVNKAHRFLRVKIAAMGVGVRACSIYAIPTELMYKRLGHNSLLAV